MEIKLLSHQEPDEFITMIRLFEDVFEMENFVMPEKRHLEALLQKPGFMAVAAKDGNKTIGAMTVYTLDQYYSTKPLAYIYDLAVLQAYQRKGVGKKLIAFIKEHCTQLGYEEVFVQADRPDKHALDFYRATAPSNEEDVLHFYYTL